MHTQTASNNRCIRSPHTLLFHSRPRQDLTNFPKEALCIAHQGSMVWSCISIFNLLSFALSSGGRRLCVSLRGVWGSNGIWTVLKRQNGLDGRFRSISYRESRLRSGADQKIDTFVIASSRFRPTLYLLRPYLHHFPTGKNGSQTLNIWGLRDMMHVNWRSETILCFLSTFQRLARRVEGSVPI
ncbi:hypothetical protein BDV96DRAFT_175176 [Lophiotrema nucula]|uniref:Uncharacterized protein n=1 Tax=Lophiotrema nucula TaxID=690887 RepID=A0A6A5Z012_9PLEO|nr:hypothetical protein BDV96DRAFT_175176 [Lophiotrema nucula]